MVGALGSHPWVNFWGTELVATRVSAYKVRLPLKPCLVNRHLPFYFHHGMTQWRDSYHAITTEYIISRLQKHELRILLYLDKGTWIQLFYSNRKPTSASKLKQANCWFKTVSKAEFLVALFKQTYLLYKESCPVLITGMCWLVFLSNWHKLQSSEWREPWLRKCLIILGCRQACRAFYLLDIYDCMWWPT